MHDNNGINDIAEWNLPHDILNPSKHEIIITQSYMDIYTHLGIKKGLKLLDRIGYWFKLHNCNKEIKPKYKVLKRCCDAIENTS